MLYTFMATFAMSDNTQENDSVRVLIVSHWGDVREVITYPGSFEWDMDAAIVRVIQDQWVLGSLDSKETVWASPQFGATYGVGNIEVRRYVFEG